MGENPVQSKNPVWPNFITTTTTTICMLVPLSSPWSNLQLPVVYRCMHCKPSLFVSIHPVFVAESTCKHLFANQVIPVSYVAISCVLLFFNLVLPVGKELGQSFQNSNTWDKQRFLNYASHFHLIMGRATVWKLVRVVVVGRSTRLAPTR